MSIPKADDGGVAYASKFSRRWEVKGLVPVWKAGVRGAVIRHVSITLTNCWIERDAGDRASNPKREAIR
jgi:hypothetical protein